MISNQDIRRLVRFCSQECEWQLVAPLAVADMVDAYFYLSEQATLSESLVRIIGTLIEGDVNEPTIWRQENVMVGGSVKPHFMEVPGLMEALLAKAKHPSRGDPVELFREFEEIHPFLDGNGRTGALLFNWWNGTYSLDDLMYPPNLWADKRRVVSRTSSNKRSIR